MVRRPGETTHHRFQACCLVPFSLPFILMPLFMGFIVWFGDKPVESLLGRIGITLFLSIFLIVGLGIAAGSIWSSLRAIGYGAKASEDAASGGSARVAGNEQWAWYPKARRAKTGAMATGGGVRLLPETTAFGKAVGMILFALVWNGIAGTIGYLMFTGDKDAPFFAKAIIAVFLLIGLLAFFGAIHAIARYFLTGDTYIDISTEPVAPGQTVSYALIQRGSFDIRSVSLKLLCRETVRYRVGTDTVRKTEVARTIELGEPHPARAERGRPVVEGRVVIPADAAVSFFMPNNRIEWGIEVELQIDGRPDVKDFFPLRVAIPAGGMR